MEKLQHNSNSDNAASALIPLPKLEPGARVAIHWIYQDPAVPIARQSGDVQYMGDSGSELPDAIAAAIRALDHPRPLQLLAQVALYLAFMSERVMSANCVACGAAEDELMAAAQRVSDAWEKHDAKRRILIDGDERRI